MAFNYFTATGNATCDKCKKPATEDKPIVELSVTGRAAMDRQFISIHVHCIQKIVNSVLSI